MNVTVSGLSFEPEFAVFRLAPGIDVRSAIPVVTQAITAAREAGATRLLLDLRVLAGATPPGLGQRYAFATEWARAARSAIAIALLAPMELVDPGRFGMLVAHGAGLDSDVFAEEPDARAWLARRPATNGPAP